MKKPAPSPKEFADFSFGLLAGLGVAGLLLAGAHLVSPSPGLMAESMTLATGGNFLIGVGLLPICWLISLVFRRPGAWNGGRGLLWGLAFGLLPVVGALLIRLGLYRGHATVGFWAFPVFALLAARLGQRFLLPTRMVRSLLAVGIAAWFFAGGLGRPPAFAIDPSSGRPSELQKFAAQDLGAGAVSDANANGAADAGAGAGMNVEPGISIAADRPDIVLISLDTTRADAVIGRNRATVPTLDGLAARGLSAPYARSGSNCTLAGHVEMFSGMGPLQHGILNNSGTTPDDLPLLGELFANAGWNTSAVISNRVIEARYGPSRGFDEWHDDLGSAHHHLRRLSDNTLLGWVTDRQQFQQLEPILFWGRLQVQTEWAAREAERTASTVQARIAELSQSPRPYFLVAHFMDSHEPYRAPAPFYGTRQAAPGESWAHFDVDRARYWEEVDYLDSQLAAVLQSLNETGRPYVILATGDHGEHLGEQQMLGHSDELFESVVRVPFFLAGAGVPQGQLPPVSLSDVAPTLLACAGLPIPASMQGGDVRQWVGESLDEQRFLFGRDERSISAVIGLWKWSADWPRGAESPELGSFRHLGDDPGERQPPVDEWVGGPGGRQPSMEKVLDPILEEIWRQVGRATQRGGGKISAERQAALNELGYVDAAESR